jgi:hypothetical protein
VGTYRRRREAAAAATADKGLSNGGRMKQAGGSGRTTEKDKWGGAAVGGKSESTLRIVRNPNKEEARGAAGFIGRAGG